MSGFDNPNGTPATGITPPAGGSGVLGFLSGIFRWTAFGQKLMVGSAPVVLASDQSAVPVSGTVTANQGAAAAAAGAWPVEQTDGAGTVIGTATHPTRVDPTGTTTQPVSASSLPLPAGASTSALQTTGNASLALIDGKLATLGQKTMAGSEPVVIASDQTPVPVNNPLQSGTWNYVAATLTGAGTVTGVGRCIGIRVFASAADGTFNINGGNTLTVRSNTGIDIDPQGNVTAPVVNWASGTLDVVVEGVS